MRYIKKIAIKVLVLLIVLVSTEKLSAQQDPMYTQYMDNLLVINPAFAGSLETGNVLLVARNQWVAFEGAPSTRSFAYHAPVENKNIGVGLSILNDKIGPQKQTGVYFDYSYFIQVSDNYRLGMGLKGGLSFFRANLTELATIIPDPTFDNDIYKNFLPNFGVGLYLYSDDSYLGFSLPRLIENRITRSEVSTEYVNIQRIHMYLMGGKRFDLNENFQIKAYSMLKWVKGAPISLDITALVGFNEKVWLGSMFRFGDSFGIIAQFKPTPKMKIGYSYDLTISNFNSYNSGSHEIMFSYDIAIF